ncbi:hypothetical protein [Pedobacter zeae]|nr:hypothetical protein [Pedobacter zeae]MBB4106164.1 hypothetical protein [Pedobacter zeae]
MDLGAILSNNKRDFNRELVHFSEKNTTIIPLDCNEYIIQMFIEQAANFDTLKEYLSHYHSYIRYKTEYKDNAIIEIIESFNLDTFVIEYNSTFADRPQDCLFLAIIDDEIMKESIFTPEIQNLCDPGPFYKIIGVDESWSSNEEIYYDYATAKKAFDKLQ